LRLQKFMSTFLYYKCLYRLVFLYKSCSVHFSITKDCSVRFFHYKRLQCPLFETIKVCTFCFFYYKSL